MQLIKIVAVNQVNQNFYSIGPTPYKKWTWGVKLTIRHQQQVTADICRKFCYYL